MALLYDHLSVWDIGFRWAGYDPDTIRFRIPLIVRDNFRTLMHEIHHGHLECATLDMSKYRGNNPDGAKFHIRYWLHEIEDFSSGRRFNKTLLKWALIERRSMQTWCERHKVPLPEFWFPPGWGIEYEWPDDFTDDEDDLPQQQHESAEDKIIRIDKRHRTRMACQQIGMALWAQNPTLTKKEVAASIEVQHLGGGSEYELETVEEWLAEVDPRDPSKKRGPKRKINSGPEN